MEELLRGNCWNGALSRLSFSGMQCLGSPLIFTIYLFQFLFTGCTNPHRMWPNRQHVWGLCLILITMGLKPTACQRHCHSGADENMRTRLEALKSHPPTLCWWWWLMPPMVWNCKLRLLSGDVHVTSNNTLLFKHIRFLHKMALGNCGVTTWDVKCLRVQAVLSPVTEITEVIFTNLIKHRMALVFFM